MTLRLPSLQDASPEDRAAIFAAARAMAAADPRPAVSTVPDVELLEVGSWDAHTPDGLPFVVTKEDISAAIAAIESGDARPPIIKLGHDSSLNDGAPAFGKIINARTSDDGMKLLGDLTGVPTWLADIMASAYPRRSIEGFQDYTSDTGRSYGFVLTAVALLGEAYPAVETLEDIRAAYATEAPALIAAGTGRHVLATHRTGEAPMPNPEPVTARATDDQVFTAFYAQMPYPYWVREFYVDPLEIIATNDDTGGLVRVPYEVAADGSVTFGDPVPVQVEYIDQPTKTAASAADPRLTPGGGHKTFATRVEARKVVASTSPEGQNEENSMSDIDPVLLRSYLGLDPDATVEAVNEKLAAQADEAANQGTDPANAPDPAAAPAAGGIPAGTVLVDQASHEEDAAFLAGLRADQEQAALASAIREKRIIPASRGRYEAAMKIDRAGTLLLLTGDDAAVQAGTALAPGLVGTIEPAGNGGDGPSENQSISAESVGRKAAFLLRQNGGR